MERAEKQKEIAHLQSVFTDVESLVLANVNALKAGELFALRRKLHEAGVGFRVIKNKLAQIAAKELPVSILSSDFAGPTAIAWSKDNPVSPSQILVEFQKEAVALKIKAGFYGGQRLDTAGVESLAHMPSLQELRAQLLGLMGGVMSKCLAQIQAPATHVIGVIEAKRTADEKKA